MRFQKIILVTFIGSLLGGCGSFINMGVKLDSIPAYVVNNKESVALNKYRDLVRQTELTIKKNQLLGGIRTLRA